jgi:outer membrane protein assembly factor BamB/ABC-type phosphate/phosphonate transport system substrate-binding protein
VVVPCHAEEKPPLTLVVMDPLALPLSCPCVKGHAQRLYEKLGEHLEKELGRPVTVLFSDGLSKILRAEAGKKVDLIIGKQSVVKFDAKINDLEIRPLAMLTDKEGKDTLTGLIVVAKDDPAKKLDDLKGYKILFGPPDCDEKYTAAAEALQKAGIELPTKLETRPGCSDSVLEMLEHREKPTAAVISSYAAALLEGCGTIEKGAIRVVGETQPVPFVAVYAAQKMDKDILKKITSALESVKKHSDLLTALESKSGFVLVKEVPTAEEKTPGKQKTSWPGWRGMNRDGLAANLPERLPDAPNIVWTVKLTGDGLSGVAVFDKYVIVADRDPSDQKDIFRCLDAQNGKELWKLEYATLGKIQDYGNAARATPLIFDGKVYALGAFGDLHCLNLADGKIVWKKNFTCDFGAVVPIWGFCGSPLVVDDKLIVNPGAAEASLVALDRVSGKEIWHAPGLPAAYSSFIVGTFGGARQIVGYDKKTLGGWEVASGDRLWTLVPPTPCDFNVPTPIDADGKLLVATENNGTRLYDFEHDGSIKRTPLAVNKDLAPDCSTPVFVGGKLFGSWDSKLYCLDLNHDLKPRWIGEDEAFHDYASLIASPDRLLVSSHRGELFLVDAAAENFKIISRLQVFDGDAGLISHPALAGNRLYIRDSSKIICVDLSGK